jgi:hypothetical protein
MIQTGIIPGSMNSRIYWFDQSTDDAADAPTIMNGWMQALERIPVLHRPFICPITVSPVICGGIRTHGGFYGAGNARGSEGNWRALWTEPATVERTRVPAEFIRALTNPLNRLIGIPIQKAREQTSRSTLMHEVAHSINESVRLYPDGATAADFPGVLYPRRQDSVHEVAAEAYARWILSPGDLARSDQRGTRLVMSQRPDLMLAEEARRESRALDRRMAQQTRQIGRIQPEQVLTRREMLADVRAEDVAIATLRRSPALQMLEPAAAGVTGAGSSGP